jgi:hypothetical protein
MPVDVAPPSIPCLWAAAMSAQERRAKSGFAGRIDVVYRPADSSAVVRFLQCCLNCRLSIARIGIGGRSRRRSRRGHGTRGHDPPPRNEGETTADFLDDERLAEEVHATAAQLLDRGVEVIDR